MYCFNYCVFNYVDVCGCVHMSAGTCGCQKSCQILGAGVTGGCVPSDIGDRNQRGSLETAVCSLNC